VFACAVVKCDCAHDWLIQRGHLIRAQVLLSKQSIHRSRRNACKELAFGISPLILFRPGHINRPRRYQSNQLMRINGQLVDMINVLLKVRREPVGKIRVQIADGSP